MRQHAHNTMEGFSNCLSLLHHKYLIGFGMINRWARPPIHLSFPLLLLPYPSTCNYSLNTRCFFITLLSISLTINVAVDGDGWVDGWATTVPQSHPSHRRMLYTFPTRPIFYLDGYACTGSVDKDAYSKLLSYTDMYACIVSVGSK